MDKPSRPLPPLSSQTAQTAKEMDDLLRRLYGNSSPFMFPRFDPGPPMDPLEQLRYENQNLIAQMRAWQKTFEQLKAMPKLHAQVVAVKDKTVTIQTGGRMVEVENPGLLPLEVGKTVNILSDTMQIVELVEAPSAGEVLEVRRVVDAKTLEVDRQGAARAVVYAGAVEEGDRVVLDPSGSVVMANLGKPQDTNLVSEATGVTWDDIGGLEEAKQELREAIEAPVKHGEMMRRFGRRAARGALLYGGPGLGKTMLGKAAATAMSELHGGNGGGFFYVKGPALLDKFVGQTESSIRKLFQQARTYKKKVGYPAIIFIDEAEAILGPRGSGLQTAERGFLSQTVVPQFLSEMDGLEESGAFVLLATNRPASLDSAIVRDGRIDRKIKVSRPGPDAARAILLKHLCRVPLAGGAGVTAMQSAADTVVESLYDPRWVLYRIQRQSSVSKGTAMTMASLVSGAMLSGIVDRAASYAMRRSMSGGAALRGEGEAVTDADLRDSVRHVFAECRDVNHNDEIAEFCEGWGDEVVAVTREKSMHAGAS